MNEEMKKIIRTQNDLIHRLFKEIEEKEKKIDDLEWRIEIYTQEIARNLEEREAGND